MTQPSTAMMLLTAATPATRSFIAIGAFDEREGQEVPVAFIVAEAAQLGRPLVSAPCS